MFFHIEIWGNLRFRDCKSFVYPYQVSQYRRSSLCFKINTLSLDKSKKTRTSGNIGKKPISTNIASCSLERLLNYDKSLISTNIIEVSLKFQIMLSTINFMKMLKHNLFIAVQYWKKIIYCKHTALSKWLEKLSSNVWNY